MMISDDARIALMSAWRNSVGRNEREAIRALFFIHMVRNRSGSLDNLGSPIRPTEWTDIVSIKCINIIQTATFLRLAQVVEPSELWLEINIGIIDTHLGTFRCIGDNIEGTKLIWQIVRIDAYGITFDKSEGVSDSEKRIFAEYARSFLGNAMIIGRYFYSFHFHTFNLCCACRCYDVLSASGSSRGVFGGDLMLGCEYFD